MDDKNFNYLEFTQKFSNSFFAYSTNFRPIQWEQQIVFSVTAYNFTNINQTLASFQKYSKNNITSLRMRLKQQMISIYFNLTMHNINLLASKLWFGGCKIPLLWLNHLTKDSTSLHKQYLKLYHLHGQKFFLKIRNISNISPIILNMKYTSKLLRLETNRDQHILHDILHKKMKW